MLINLISSLVFFLNLSLVVLLLLVEGARLRARNQLAAVDMLVLYIT
jgi:hypothetical protein